MSLGLASDIGIGLIRTAIGTSCAVFQTVRDVTYMDRMVPKGSLVYSDGTIAVINPCKGPYTKDNPHIWAFVCIEEGVPRSPVYIVPDDLELMHYTRVDSNIFPERF